MKIVMQFKYIYIIIHQYITCFMSSNKNVSNLISKMLPTGIKNVTKKPL
jgi:hypothetical protein